MISLFGLHAFLDSKKQFEAYIGCSVNTPCSSFEGEGERERKIDIFNPILFEISKQLSPSSVE